MRALVLAVPALLACAPKVSTTPPSFDEDVTRDPHVAAPAAPAPPAERPIAPPGKGLRTGTIARDRLLAVLDAGPATFLRQLEVAPRMNGERFVGWELVQLVDHHSPLYDVDLVPGDVLLAINGKPVSRPDQLQAVWDSLRTADAVTAQLWRGQAKLTLEFAVEPKLAP
jgi:type II secretory pathway component PulC